MRPFRRSGFPDVEHWSWAAVATIVAMLTYFIVTNHVDLSPWNNLGVAGPQLASTLSGVIPFAIIATVFAIRIPWLMLVGMIYAWVWLLLQIQQWWIPYVFGETRLHRSFVWYVEGGYNETVSLLPEIAGRPVPDAQHLVLELLSLLVVITTTTALLHLWRARGRTPAAAHNEQTGIGATFKET